MTVTAVINSVVLASLVMLGVRLIVCAYRGYCCGIASVIAVATQCC